MLIDISKRPPAPSVQRLSECRRQALEVLAGNKSAGCTEIHPVHIRILHRTINRNGEGPPHSSGQSWLSATDQDHQRGALRHCGAPSPQEKALPDDRRVRNNYPKCGFGSHATGGAARPPR